MNIQSHAYNYFPKVAHPAIPQNRLRSRGLTLPGGTLLWSAACKIFLIILPVTLIFNLWFSSIMGSFEERIAQEQQNLLQLENTNVALKAEKAQLFSPQYMVALAEDRLSLRAPVPDQIKRM